MQFIDACVYFVFKIYEHSSVTISREFLKTVTKISKKILQLFKRFVYMQNGVALITVDAFTVNCVNLLF